MLQYCHDVVAGRADYNGMLITGKAIPFWGGMFFPLNGHEVKNTSFEVLVTDNPSMFKWVAAAGSKYDKTCTLIHVYSNNMSSNMLLKARFRTQTIRAQGQCAFLEIKFVNTYKSRSLSYSY